MSTQEKLRKIYNQIGESFYWEGSYGDDDPQVEIGRQQFVDEIMQLIESAKREAIENHPIISLLHELDDTLPEGKYSTITMQYMPGGKAKFEQSEESI